MLVIALVAFAIFLIIYILTRKDNRKLVPKGVLFFYSMENCFFCEMLETQLNYTDHRYEVFKITLKSDGTKRYSKYNKEYIKLSEEFMIEGYPTLIIHKNSHLGRMTDEELNKFLNVDNKEMAVPKRIVCIGDIHGDFQIFKKVLAMCKLIDESDNWIGGDTYLVQLGDTLDGKRPNVVIEKEFLEQSGEVEIIKFILELDAMAKTKGGRVISILGNHELYPYYLASDSNFIKEYVKESDIKAFKKNYNTERIKFLRPGGLGGSLLGRTRPLLLQLGQFLFVHGSITDDLITSNLKSDGFVDISKINKDTSMWLQGKSNIPSYLSGPESGNPVFSREYSETKTIKSEICKKINDQIKKFKGVNYVIMGHSSHKEINTACDGRLIRTDVSLSRAFGGKMSDKKLQALEIINNGSKPVVNIISQKGTVSLN